MKHLVVGPGAMAFFGCLGALSALKDANELGELEDISGASAGGLVAFLYVVAQGDMKRVIDYTLRIPIKDAMRYNIRLFLKNFGLVTTHKIRTIITDIIYTFLEVDNPRITFRQLRQLRPNSPRLYISAYCVNTGTTMYFSDLVTPDVEIVNVLCMTIAVPLLFSSVEWEGRRYIDGGTVEEVPCSVFLGKNPDDVCVICHSPESRPTYDTTSFKDYISSIFSLTLHLRHKYPQFRTVPIFFEHTQTFDFSMKFDTKVKMITHGYICAQKKVLPMMIQEVKSETTDPQEQSSPVHGLVPIHPQDQ